MLIMMDDVAYLSFRENFWPVNISSISVLQWDFVGRETNILLDFQFTALLEIRKDNCISSGSNMAVFLFLLFSCLETKFPSIMSIFAVDLLPSGTFLWCVCLLRPNSSLCLTSSQILKCRLHVHTLHFKVPSHVQVFWSMSLLSRYIVLGYNFSL